MNVIILNTYEELSTAATKVLIDSIKATPNPLVCVASGDSPKGLYKHLVTSVEKNSLNTADWHFLGLDEWIGLNGQDIGSCRYHLDQDLFHPLGVPDEQICFFDGRSVDVFAECLINEMYIKKQGGIDVAILGLGLNGHIGMNEPFTPVDSRSQMVDLDPLTIQIGQKYFEQPQKLSQGLTLGLGTLMEARSILLLVGGQNKAPIVKKMLEEEVSLSCPASLLRHHPNCHIFLDQAAGSLLDPKKGFENI
jgi:glucosamine-6-phosphate isomerase